MFGMSEAPNACTMQFHECWAGCFVVCLIGISSHQVMSGFDKKRQTAPMSQVAIWPGSLVWLLWLLWFVWFIWMVSLVRLLELAATSAQIETTDTWITAVGSKSSSNALDGTNRCWEVYNCTCFILLHLLTIAFSKKRFTLRRYMSDSRPEADAVPVNAAGTTSLADWDAFSVALGARPEQLMKVRPKSGTAAKPSPPWSCQNYSTLW